MEKELVEFMVRSLVDQPDEVTVNVIEGEKSTILELHVAEGDVGKVIGKQGRIAKAIRTILSASATRDGKRNSTCQTRSAYARSPHPRGSPRRPRAPTPTPGAKGRASRATSLLFDSFSWLPVFMINTLLSAATPHER